MFGMSVERSLAVLDDGREKAKFSMDWIGRRRGRLIKGDLRASVRRFVFYALDEREEWRWRCGRAELQRADKTLHTFPGAVSRLGRTTAAELSH